MVCRVTQASQAEGGRVQASPRIWEALPCLIACLPQLIDRSTSCLLGTEGNVSLRDAFSLWRAGWRDAD